MNQEIIDKLEWRSTVINNLESLAKYGSNKDVNQLSLFGDNQETISMEIPKSFNYKEMLDNETEVLGVNLTYNIFDRYVLINKRFCNATIRTVVEMSESATKLLFIASVKDIEYKKSLAGNNYAKILLQDHDSSISAFLWGDFYSKKISTIFKDNIYLIEVNYNNENNSTSIVNLRNVNDINIEDYISKIILHIDNPKNTAMVVPYVHSKMFGSTYDFNFNYKGDTFGAPYKINFTEEDYIYLKEFITDLTVEK